MPSEFDQSKFVDNYSRAFVFGGGREIGRFYNIPCLTVRGDGSLRVFTSREEVEGFFENALEAYRSEEMRKLT